MSQRSSSPSLPFSLSVAHLLTPLLVWWFPFTLLPPPSEPYLSVNPELSKFSLTESNNSMWWLCEADVLLSLISWFPHQMTLNAYFTTFWVTEFQWCAAWVCLQNGGISFEEVANFMTYFSFSMQFMNIFKAFIVEKFRLNYLRGHGDILNFLFYPSSSQGSHKVSNVWKVRDCVFCCQG